MVLYQFKAKQIVKNLIPVIVGFSFLLIEYLLIYKYSYGDYSSTKSTVIINPFCVWSRYTPCIFISVILSVFFPLAYILIYFKEARQNNLLKYAVFSFFVSIVIYSLFAESGPKKFDANFSWQSIICSYILFWVTGLEFLKKN